MVSFDEVKTILDNLKISKEEKDKYAKLFEPYYEFNKFLKEKLSLSDAGVNTYLTSHMKMNEKDITEAMSNMMVTATMANVDVKKEIVAIMLTPIRELCEKHGYTKTDDLVSSLTEVMPQVFS